MQHAMSSDWLDALHLSSASLPVGGFAYSQGLEQACACGRVTDVASAQHWISDYLQLVVARQELPWWHAIAQACAQTNWDKALELSQSLAALRETAELRLESTQMAHAMVKLYEQWLDPDYLELLPVELKQALANDYTAAHAGLCAARGLSVEIGMSAWVWSWLDNQVLAAVKLVPLGQRHGQQMLHALKTHVPAVIEQGMQTPLDQAGCAAFGLMLASTQHETQYARLFRS